MSLESESEKQPFPVRRVVLASGWRQELTSLLNMMLTCPSTRTAIFLIFFVLRIYQLGKM